MNAEVEAEGRGAAEGRRPPQTGLVLMQPEAGGKVQEGRGQQGGASEVAQEGQVDGQAGDQGCRSGIRQDQAGEAVARSAHVRSHDPAETQEGEECNLGGAKAVV